MALSSKKTKIEAIHPTAASFFSSVEKVNLQLNHTNVFLMATGWANSCNQYCYNYKKQAWLQMQEEHSRKPISQLRPLLWNDIEKIAFKPFKESKPTYWA